MNFKIIILEPYSLVLVWDIILPLFLMYYTQVVEEQSFRLWQSSAKKYGYSAKDTVFNFKQKVFLTQKFPQEKKSDRDSIHLKSSHPNWFLPVSCISQILFSLVLNASFFSYWVMVHRCISWVLLITIWTTNLLYCLVKLRPSEDTASFSPWQGWVRTYLWRL